MHHVDSFWTIFFYLIRNISGENAGALMKTDMKIITLLVLLYENNVSLLYLTFWNWHVL